MMMEMLTVVRWQEGGLVSFHVELSVISIAVE